MFRKAIVRPPSSNFAEGLTTVKLGKPDFARAMAQHESYCAALERCGLILKRLKADPTYPDSTFVEDTAVVTERCAILTNPGATSRTGEVEGIGRALAELNYVLQAIHAPGTLDGGDVCQAGDHFFIGISQRTNESGAQQLADTLLSFGYTSTFVDIRSLPGILHLKSGLACLGGRLVVTGALSHFKEFEKYNLVRLNAGEDYAANCIRVNNHVLVAAGYAAFETELRSLGYETISLDMSEFRKMDGGLSCLSLRF